MRPTRGIIPAEFAGSAELGRQILEFRQSVMDRYGFRVIVDMDRRLVNKARHSIGIDLYEIKTWKIAVNVTATGFAEFPEVGLGLVEGGNVVLPLGDPHIFWRPKTKGIDRCRSPRSAIVAVAISYHRRRTGNYKLNRATET